VLQRVAACCSVLQHGAMCVSIGMGFGSVVQCVPCVAMAPCSMLCCSVLQCVAVCCSVLQCVFGVGIALCGMFQCVALFIVCV